MDGTEEKEFRDMFLMISGGSKLVPVLAVRSMLYKLTCQNPDAEHKVSISELQELMEEAMGIPNPEDRDYMTFSQFKKMMTMAS
eukprot:scaffold626394_cov33-Prasinocladus_malaysianus.AAC.1